MRREVVQNFLNLPGVAGVALMDGRSRPYFCGIDQRLNFQQKEALVRGIQQVVNTTPPGFKFFEFQFSGQQVYLYKLEHGIILLVLTTRGLVYSSYAEAIEQLKQELQQDIVNSIATFRLLAGSTTLSKQDYWQQAKAEAVPTVPPEVWLSSSSSLASPFTAPPTPAPVSGSSSQPDPGITVRETIAAMNQLSQFTIQYLGGTVVTNYWKATRPDTPWLQQFQVERSAQITFSASTLDNAVLTHEQQQWIQDWVEAFIQRCAKVMRDFPKTVRQQALNAQQQFLLRDKPA